MLSFDLRRQRHVKAELVHDIWVTPRRKVFALSLCQSFGSAAGNVRVGKRGSEGFECFDNGRGKYLQRRVQRMRHEREKRPQLSNDNPRYLEWLGRRGEALESLNQILLGVAFSKCEGCLQCRMKAVSRWFRNQRLPLLDWQGEGRRRPQKLAIVRVAAKPLAGVLRQRAVWGRSEVDGVSQGRIQ